eukprot:TRINITY_DN2243_c2_g3_i2.p1 TRINITY_DN2243_c2_g3~~TRINITY_DN2243_c2_g3_i2.p1  ORF type:complete len:310 (+),score=-79.69 TRINITY_DN2243_c2_g3_i2:571-1500(+)
MAVRVLSLDSFRQPSTVFSFQSEEVAKVIPPAPRRKEPLSLCQFGNPCMQFRQNARAFVRPPRYRFKGAPWPPRKTRTSIFIAGACRSLATLLLFGTIIVWESFVLQFKCQCSAQPPQARQLGVRKRQTHLQFRHSWRKRESALMLHFSSDSATLHAGARQAGAPHSPLQLQLTNASSIRILSAIGFPHSGFSRCALVSHLLAATCQACIKQPVAQGILTPQLALFFSYLPMRHATSQVPLVRESHACLRLHAASAPVALHYLGGCLCYGTRCITVPPGSSVRAVVGCASGCLPSMKKQEKINQCEQAR